jgi:ThiF family
MSQQLIDRNPDLKRLRDEGYCVEIRNAFLLVHRIPYVTEQQQVEFGSLVSNLTMAGDLVTTPDNHVAHFIGGQPCHKDGRAIQQIMHQVAPMVVDGSLVASRSFSNKPPEGYKDYYHKMSTYSDIISGPAFSIDPSHTAKVFAPIPTPETESVFNYLDTATSRAGISAVSDKLAFENVAIIGLGGTGSYILDLVAKTHVKKIHLFDGDKFLSHNAFRSPGAATVNDLEQQNFKVDYFFEIYRKLHRGIVPHAFPVTEDNAANLDGLDFAFVSVDGGESKRRVLEALELRNVPYIDCGMGIELVDNALTGQVRTTLSIPTARSHIWEKGALSFADGEADNEYAWNIQIADLNALNASLAVIRWKRWAGFYLDLERELHCLYPIDGNTIVNAHHLDEEGELA